MNEKKSQNHKVKVGGSGGETVSTKALIQEMSCMSEGQKGRCKRRGGQGLSTYSLICQHCEEFKLYQYMYEMGESMQSCKLGSDVACFVFLKINLAAVRRKHCTAAKAPCKGENRMTN